MENLFGIMKQEMYHGKIYSNFDELQHVVDKYIDSYNNKHQRKTELVESRSVQKSERWSSHPRACLIVLQEHPSVKSHFIPSLTPDNYAKQCS